MYEKLYKLVHINCIEYGISLLQVSSSSSKFKESESVKSNYLYIQSLMGTLCLVKARLFSNWWIQWTGRKPGMLALRFAVTGTFTACDVTTCSVKIS
jgi:hypothetical protein